MEKRTKGRSRGNRPNRQGDQQDVQQPGPEIPNPTQHPSGRAQYRGAATPGGLQRNIGQASAALAGLNVGGNGNGNGNGNNGEKRGRGSYRGRRLISGSDMKLYHSRPDRNINKQGAGDPVSVRANYYEFKKNSKWQLNLYHVVFNPETDVARDRKAMVRLHKKIFKANYIFDGANLYCQDCLPNKETVVNGKKEDGSAYTLTFKRVKELDPTDLQYIQVLNIILRRCQERIGLTLVGRNYYDAKQGKTLEALKLTIWPGFTTSIRHHEESILLNVDVSHKIIRNETVLEVLLNMRRASKPFDELLGSIVMTKYNSSTYKVDQVDQSLKPSSTFPYRGGQMSYNDYYKQKYNLIIRDQGQPLLKSTPKERDRRRGDNQDIILVPELCTMTGISEAMRNDFRAMKEISNTTKPDPNLRVQSLQQFNARLRGQPEVAEELKSWDIELSPELVDIKAHLTKPEFIMQGSTDPNQKIVYNRAEADWGRVTRGRKMNECMNIKSWAVIYLKRNVDDTHGFVKDLQFVAPGLGLRFPDPMKFEIQMDHTNQYTNQLHKCVGVDFVMCILPNNRSDRYGSLKKELSDNMGIPSQFILAKTIMKPGQRRSVATKVAIQINCKLGGEPWNVEMPFKAMYVGYDTHHQARNKSVSYGATVATYNKNATKYFGTVVRHSAGEELSSKFYQSFRACLTNFANHNGCHPGNIMLFRDGVGDSQIEYVKEVEIKEIKKILNDLYPNGKRPKLIVVIVSKRINTRIFKMDRNNIRNPEPGTVVDSVVTLPERYDFFLVSQSVRQGTVSPTSYNVIEDETTLTPDQMQRISYKMCHLYYNWQGTVATPAPCMYAHKLAFMAGNATQENVHPNLANKLWYL